MANNYKDEPKTAPQPDRWYNLTLGSSFNDNSSNKYCTLRYEFKPASIDKTKRGTLHKNKDNRVSVEFQHNQLGKPKMTFEGSSEDYKETDAVLFFDGQTFRLDRLHRAVNQLRRMPGESASASAAAQLGAAVGAAVEPRLSPVGKGSTPMQMGRISIPPVPVEVEKIDIGQPENSGSKPAGKMIGDPFDQRNVSSASRDHKNDEGDDHQDIYLEQLFGAESDVGDAGEQKANAGFGINESDDEIADVDDSDNEANKGPNAAEALRAQVNAEERRSSSSSGSSGSSGSSSDSDGSGEEDSVSSI